MSKSKSKSKKKLQLTKAYSSGTLTSQPTLSQAASKPLLERPQNIPPISQNPKSPKVNFNYSTRSNYFSSTLAHPATSIIFSQTASSPKYDQYRVFNPYEIEEHISRIDYGLATLKNELETSIRENSRTKKEVVYNVHQLEPSHVELRKGEEKLKTEHSLNQPSSS